MRVYDVYRYDASVARVRLLESDEIEWAYHQEHGHGQGFWWSNNMKNMMDEFIKRYPDFEEMVVGEFTLRQCETK
jgi:hypothetical protein